jgi:hypothetical protein
VDVREEITRGVQVQVLLQPSLSSYSKNCVIHIRILLLTISQILDPAFENGPDPGLTFI